MLCSNNNRIIQETVNRDSRFPWVAQRAGQGESRRHRKEAEWVWESLLERRSQ